MIDKAENMIKLISEHRINGRKKEKTQFVSKSVGHFLKACSHKISK